MKYVITKSTITYIKKSTYNSLTTLLNIQSIPNIQKQIETILSAFFRIFNKFKVYN